MGHYTCAVLQTDHRFTNFAKVKCVLWTLNVAKMVNYEKERRIIENMYLKKQILKSTLVSLLLI